jgi:hypothetical protein
MNWDADYPNNKFIPPQGCKLVPVNTEQNHVVSREQLQDCGHLSYLVTEFKEEYIWLEVQSVWLFQKLKKGNGFQDWHRDLACNVQTVYTIVVNLGSFKLQANAGEITKTMLMMLHMLQMLSLHLHLTILMEMMKAFLREQCSLISHLDSQLPDIDVTNHSD